MAAFTPEDPHDRERFDAHMSRVMTSPENTNRAVTWKGDLVGSIASRIRPLYARAASDNAGSLRVLGKTGFRIIDTEVSFAPARGTEIEETILRLG